MKRFKISELVAGEIYKCRLTGRPVLIVQSEPMEYDTPKYGKIKTHFMRGEVYNPVTGRTEDVYVHDDQLESI